MPKEIDKEEMVGQLLCGWVSIEGKGWTDKKHSALERYMRTYLRALTYPELEYELKWCEDNNKMSAGLQAKVNQAVEGYDAFMARREAKVR